MAKFSLESLRALHATDSNQTDRSTNKTPYYPFWDMKVGQKAIVRFVPDKNEDNPQGFLQERIEHKLTVNGKSRTVPCLGDGCPICKLSQEYYAADDEKNGSKYWKKRKYLAQVLVVSDPLPANAETGETYQGKVMPVLLSSQVYKSIKAALLDTIDPLKGVPFFFDGGHDFVISKSNDGKYDNYSGKFISSQRDLSDIEVEIVEDTYVELHTLLPKVPSFDEVTALLNADVTGTEYKTGTRSNNGQPAQNTGDHEEAEEPSVKPTKRAEHPKEQAPEESEAATQSPDVNEMLAKLRARKKQ